MHTKPDAPVFKPADGERSATWLELFFDLAFVVSVAALNYRLEHNFNWQGVLNILLYFLPIWWMWMEYSYYGDFFDDNSISYQALMILAMGCVMYLALVIRSEAMGTSWRFGATYLAMAAVSLLMYVRAYLFYPGLRWFCRRFIGCIALSLGCFALSLFVEEPYRYVLWLLGVGIQRRPPPPRFIYPGTATPCSFRICPSASGCLTSSYWGKASWRLRQPVRRRPFSGRRSWRC